MSDIKIIHDAQRQQVSGGRKAFTFTVDGVDSLYWCPSEAAVNRAVKRLKEGRSGEAFGGAGIAAPGDVKVTSRGHKKPGRGKVVAVGEVVTETVTMKSGKEKVREKRPGWTFEIDGKTPEQFQAAMQLLEQDRPVKAPGVFQSQAEAKIECACSAFMTRGKLGRFREAEAAFKELTGKQCRVHLFHHRVVAKDQDGALWSVGILPDEPIKFKLLVPAAPK